MARLLRVTSSAACLLLVTLTAVASLAAAQDPTPPPPTTPNCPAAGGAGGVNCGADTQCCGYSTMNPHCINPASGDHCCVWFKSSATCNSTQSCCGMLGVGASSYAYCCNEGSTCCKSMGSGTGTSSCCPTGSTCCQGASVGLCCAAGEECVPNENRCRPIGAGETTTTNAPTVPATTAASFNCPAWGSGGVNCGPTEDCCGSGTMNPHCVAQGNGDQCCVWWKSSATCNSTQSCCGMMGVGASSYAYCCNEGSTCCKSMGSGTGTSSCCPTGSTCCQGASVGLCCAAGEECVPNENRCRAVTAAPANQAARKN